MSFNEKLQPTDEKCRKLAENEQSSLLGPATPDCIDVGVQIPHVLAPVGEDGIVVVDLEFLVMSSYYNACLFD